MKKIIALILVVIAVMIYVKKNNTEVTTSSEKPAVVIVLERNDQFPDVNVETIFEDDILSVVENYGYLRIIVADAKPYTACRYNIEKYEKNYSKSKVKNLNKSRFQQICADIKGIDSKTDEVDLIKAMNLTYKELKSCKDADTYKIIMVCSGKSTSGLMNFNDPKLNNSLFVVEPEAVVQKLNSMYAIKDFSFIDEFYWYGLGSASTGSKQEFPPNAVVNMQSIYDCIGNAAGCVVDFDETPIDGSSSSKHTCSVYQFEDEVLNFDAELAEADMKLTEDKLKFIENTAEFADEASAREILKPIAKKMVNSSNTVTIVGMTATYGTREGCIKLSCDRAETTKKLLISLSNGKISDDRILTKGLGFESNSKRLNDLGDDGILNEYAKQNRCVIICGSENPFLEEVNSIDTSI